MSVITLLTDFGLRDTYVGQMKGAVLAIAPSATIVDLTHLVPPQDVQAGAFLLWSAVEVFSHGTIHVAVVDPGVGSPRRPVAIETKRGDLFVGPDNGLLMPAAERLGGIARSVVLTQQPKSSTFHGRDLFAPVAAQLANGVALETLGEPASQLVESPWPRPSANIGEVIHVDTYGNLITNLPAARLPTSFRVLIGQTQVAQAPFYAAVEPGELLALVGSAGLLEISARNASAAAITNARRGTPVSVERR